MHLQYKACFLKIVLKTSLCVFYKCVCAHVCCIVEWSTSVSEAEMNPVRSPAHYILGLMTENVPAERSSHPLHY